MPRPRQFDEDRVLRAAADVFRRRGYAGASVEELTAATGLGKGSLYGAYGSKHGLFLAALDRYADRNVGAVTTTLAGSGAGASDELSAYLDGVVRTGGDGSPSCLLTVASAELADQDDAVEERLRAAFDGLSQGLRTAVERGQAEGTIAADVDPQAAADLLLVVARGVEVLAHAGLPPERLTDATELAVRAIARRP